MPDGRTDVLPLKLVSKRDLKGEANDLAAQEAARQVLFEEERLRQIKIDQ